MALPEPLAKSTKNREASDPDEDSPEPLIKRTRKSEDLDSETPSYKKAELQAREKEPSSPYSDYTTGDEDEGETDSSCWSEHKENDSAGHWTYKDLMNLNISYEKTPLESFIKEVKDAFMNAKGFCPDSSRMNSVLKRHLENLAFSYDTTDLRDDRVYSNPYFEVRMILKEMKKYLQQWNKNSEKLLNENQFYEALDPSTKKSAQKLIDVLDFAVQTFAGETIQLVRKILLEKESDEGRGGRARGQGSKGHHGGKAREQSRGGQGGLHGCQDTEFVQISGNFLKNYFDIFGRMFFLVSGEVHAGCFTFENRTVRTTPDGVYNYLADSGYPPDELFFIVEARKAEISHEDSTDMEKLVGQNIMGQVGSELFGRSLRSLFYPNCLGILCIETKLIFVFLKISKEHSVSIRKGDTETTQNPGKILYTEPFDILKAEDRLKIAEFMFWLGFVQDPRKYDFL